MIMKATSTLHASGPRLAGARGPGLASALSAAFCSATLLAGCGSSDPSPPAAPGSIVPIPAGASVGDEIVADVTLSDVPGDWSNIDAAGVVIELKLGGNAERHVIAPASGPTSLRASLGAWDGGDLRAIVKAGQATFHVDAVVDPSAAGLPVMGLYDEQWWDDSPLGMYREDDLSTYIMSNENGGTGLFPTLLMARWGRPVDIEGLYRGGASPEIQADGHAWTAFDGPFEGSHPRLQIITANGLVGPDTGSVFRVSPMPIDFTTQGDAIQRERALDKEPWILAASFAEVTRQGQLAADGGPDDALYGAPEDYVFIDYDFESQGAVMSFEAKVGAAWVSSLGEWTSLGGLTDAHISGVGRTCIELPPGSSASDITALSIVAAGSGSGTLKSARWFRYDAGLVPIEMGDVKAPVSIGDGFTPAAALFGSL